jgi:hypothetical protein
MKAHVLDSYRGVTARNSFIGSDGQIVYADVDDLLKKAGARG